MDWTTIIISIIGSGVISTIVNAVINRHERTAKADGIDISNLQSLVTTLANRLDVTEVKADRDREEAQKHIEHLGNEIGNLRSQINLLERVTTQAYRCRYPENIIDCPVVKAYEAKHCDECDAQETCGHA